MIQTKLAEILAEPLETDAIDITPETELAALDSLQMARAVIECEKKFRITVFDEDVHAFKTANDVAKYIEAKQDEAGMSAERAESERDGWYYG